MQRVKALIKARHSFQTLGFLSHQRCLSAQPNYAPYHDFQDQVFLNLLLYLFWVYIYLLYGINFLFNFSFEREGELQIFSVKYGFCA